MSTTDQWDNSGVMAATRFILTEKHKVPVPTWNNIVNISRNSSIKIEQKQEIKKANQSDMAHMSYISEAVESLTDGKLNALINAYESNDNTKKPSNFIKNAYSLHLKNNLKNSKEKLQKKQRNLRN